MSNKIKFHLDENVSNAIANGLRVQRILSFSLGCISYNIKNLLTSMVDYDALFRSS